MARKADAALTATELREALGKLVRRLRAEDTSPYSQAVVLGRLDRDGGQSVSDLAGAEGVRPQSMAQTVGDMEADGLVRRRPDPHDRRRALVEMTERGSEELRARRHRREGWLATVIAQDLSAEEQASLRDAVKLLRRLADS